MGSFHVPRPVVGLCLLIAVSSLATGCTGPHSHEHEEEAEVPMESVTLASGSLELFMEHPYLVRGEGAKFNVHLTVLKDGMPIRSGKLTVIAKGPTGKTATVVQDAPKRPGIFGPVVPFLEPGENEMSLSLQSKQATDTVRVSVSVHADRNAAKKAADEAKEEETDGAITFLKEQAWKIGVVHEPVTSRRLVERLAAPGELLPAAGAKAVVTSPMPGRLLPPHSGPLPHVGETVEAGQILALVEPPTVGPGGAAMLADRAQVQAVQADLAVRLKEAEIDIEKAKADLDLASLTLDRVKTLGSGNAVAKKDVDEAERGHRVAVATYRGKQEARSIYDRARKDLAAMLTSGVPAAGPKSQSSENEVPMRDSRIPLVAPLSGTITAAQVTEGEFIDPTKPLFTVINLERLWLEAKVSEYDLERVVKAPGASFTLASYPKRRLGIFGEGGGKLIDVGSVVDPANRTLPVRYEVPNAERLLKVGMFADVAIETTRTEETVAVPESALVDEDGRPVVYVLLDGEHFEKRDVELGIRDSGFVEVREGLKAGERVVTKGAYAIRLAAVSSVIPAHGHTH